MESNEIDLSASSGGLAPPDERMQTDAPSRTPEEQRADDADFLNGIVATFLQKKDKWSMANIIPAFRASAERIHTYEAKHDRPLEDNCFVALELIPAILYFIAKKMFEELPESCQLVEHRQQDFVLSLLAIMDPYKYPRGVSIVQSFNNLLTSHYDISWSRALHHDLADHLVSTATLRLERYKEGLKELNSEQECAEYREAYQAQHPEFDGQRLYNVATRHFPCGFNTFDEERYIYFDIRYLLFPTKRDIKCEKTITPETNAYLLRSAAELMEDEIQQDEQDPVLMDHLRGMLERGYPAGYTVVVDEDSGELDEQ
jgi:hypothetical protein